MSLTTYLQLTSALPLNANIYGLGEAVASSGFRRAISTDGGTLQTMWARDIADPIDENVYVSEAFTNLQRIESDHILAMDLIQCIWSTALIQEPMHRRLMVCFF